VRVLLFTGKGGVGKTTAAAGTAALAARAGHKTLVLSTDAAHSLTDAFGVPVADRAGEEELLEIEPGLAVLQVDTQRRFERSWGEIQAYLMSLLDAAGADAIQAEELTVLPGAEEVLALLEVRDRVRSGSWDVVVLDCAPTAETLRLLALPELLEWYMTRVFPLDRRLLRSLRPVLGWSAGGRSTAALPRDRVFAAVERLHSELADVRRVLTGPETSVRLVLTPEAVVVAEARRTLTSLSLYGYRVDGVVANRVFPAEGADPWRSAWVAAQAGHLADVAASFGDLPLWRAPYEPAEPVGVDALAHLARQTYDGQDPLGLRTGPATLLVERSGEEFVLSFALPLANRREMDLSRHGDELVLTVAGHRRIVALPAALRRCTVVGAALRDGRLRVRFEPDPALWRSL
jgi:arsenite-transporting ATPase